MSLDFLAGCIGGVAGVFVGHPLDTVRVNIQTQCARNPKYRGSLDCFKSLLRKEGVRGLYRGVSSPVAGVAGVNAVMFGVYANVERNMADPRSLKTQIAAATTAGVFSSFISSPMELAKSRIQVAGKLAGKSPLDCLIRTYKQENIKGVFRGFGITMAREVPAMITYFVTYEFLSRTTDDRVASTPQILFAGGVAGVVSWLVPYPIDVIKSKFQVDGVATRLYAGYADCLRKTVANEGLRSLYRGLAPTLVRAFPVNAVTFCAVEWSMRLFERGAATLGRPEEMLKQCVDVVLTEKACPC
ncbi:unnamed protein product [Phyllotreta striolata]|uniref:Mitochondrial basic amino acids transporter n=1 Tax=Phyllotreta striolata TaxID=444603 RepID=A0A9N9XQF1_PHYSR|nr:unnamed protein product [Phyllotreta striolata]